MSLAHRLHPTTGLLLILLLGVTTRSIGALEAPPTGARPPTPAEEAAWRAGAQRITRVHLNRIGQQRVRAHRRAGGLAVEALAAPEEAARAVGEELDLAPLAAETAPARIESTAVTYTLPDAVDNSTLACFPPIGDQGSLGSCASFSTTYYMLTHMTGLVRDWDASSGGDAYRFSTKWTYNLINGGSDSGSSRQAAIALFADHGAATLAELAYDNDYRSWVRDAALWRTAMGRRIAAYGEVDDLDTDAGLLVLKQLLNNGYICTFGASDPSEDWQVRNMGGTKVVYVADDRGSGHAMTIVGYDDTLWCDINGDGDEDPYERGALKIANSWGPSDSWGMNDGFYWVAYDALRDTSRVEANGTTWPIPERRTLFNEADWIVPRVAYTPELVATFTLRHANRGKMALRLGIGDSDATTAATSWRPAALRFDGGAYAFDGSTSTCDGAFALDFTDLLPQTAGTHRFFLAMESYTQTGDQRILAYALTDADGTILADGVGTPADAAGDEAEVWASFDPAAAQPTTVWLEVIDATASEADHDSASLRIHRDTTAAACQVRYRRSGSAASGDVALACDGAAIDGVLSFPAGTASLDLTLTPIDDWQHEDSESVRIELLAGGAIVTGDPDAATIRITDNDPVQLVLDTTRLYVPEGDSASVHLRLSAAPAAPLTVTVAQLDAYETDLGLTGAASFTFDADDWDQPRMITVAAAQDDDTWSGNVGFRCEADGCMPQDFYAYEIDDDKAAVEVAASSLVVDENGTATLGVRLSAAPSENETVRASFDGGDRDLSVSGGAELVFTPANWDTWQQVTVAAADDLDGYDGEALLYVEGARYAFVAVHENDDDPTSIAILPVDHALHVKEADSAPRSLSFSLSGPPAQAVEVLVEQISGDTDIIVTDPGPFTFTPENWNTPQSAAVRALQDTDAVDGTAVLRCRIAGLAAATVTAREQDIDKVTYEVDTNSLAVHEGGTASLRVRLTSPPRSTVDFTVDRVSGDADISLDQGANLTFGRDDWSQWQSIRFAAANDADAANGSATFELSTPAAWTVTTVTVDEADAASTAIVVDRSVLAIAENDESILRVRLNRAPDSELTVSAATGSGAGDCSFPGSSELVFDDTNWSDWQDLRVAAADDSNSYDDHGHLTLSANGLEDHEPAVRIIDDDVVQLVAEREPLGVSEGGTAIWRVRLDRAPGAALTVTCSAANGDPDLTMRDASGAPTGSLELDFDDGDWDSWHEITLRADADADAAEGWLWLICYHNRSGPLNQRFLIEERDDEARRRSIALNVAWPAGSIDDCVLRLDDDPYTDTPIESGKSTTFAPLEETADHAFSFHAVPGGPG